MTVFAPILAASVIPFLVGPELEDATGGQELLESALVAAFLLGLGLFQIPLGKKIANWLGDPFLPSRQAFRLLDIPVTVALFFVGNTAAVMGGHYLSAGVVGIPSPEFLGEMGAVQMLVLTALGQLPVALYIVLVAARRRGGLAALGVKRLTPGPRGRYTVARYIIALPMIYGLGVLTSVLYLLSGEELAQQDAAKMIADGLQSNPVLIIVFAAVIIPLLGEILFRGFLLELLVARGGRVFGIVFSSAAFALLHGVEVFLPIFGLAVILAIVKLRTRSLGAACLVHGLHNGSSVLVLALSLTVD